MVTLALRCSIRSMRSRSVPIFLYACGVFAQSTPDRPDVVLVQDVRVFDGERVLDHQDVLLENGKIGHISPDRLPSVGRAIIEGQGRTLLPRLIDAHVHVAANPADSLGQALSLGVTTALDMFETVAKLQELKQLESTDPAGIADARSAGVGATAPYGHPSEMGGAPFPTIAGPGQAEAFVGSRIAEGSDYIKVIYDDLSAFLPEGRRLPILAEETLRALIEAAHKRGKLAVVHIGTESQARDAISAGADGLAHMFLGARAGEDFG